MIGIVSRFFKKVVALLKATYENWRADRAIRLGAGLAYYALFAAVPLVTTAFAVAGLLFSETDIRDFLNETLANVLAPEVRQALTDVAYEASINLGGTTLFSLIAGIVAASFGITALQDTFSLIFDLPIQRGLSFSVRRRLVAFAVVLSTGALLAVSILVQTVSTLVEQVLPGRFDAVDQVNQLLVNAATWAIAVGALAVLFQLLIRLKLAWRHVLLASIVTVLLFILGSWALGVYFANFGSTSLTGLAGAILVILVFLYYQAQILIAGAELLKTLEEQAA